MYKIFSNYRRVYIQRDGQTVEVTTGDVISTQEFATIVSEGNVECVEVATDKILVYTPDAAPAPVVEPAAVVTENTPATDAGRVPEPVSTGSKNSKA